MSIYCELMLNQPRAVTKTGADINTKEEIL